MTNRSARLALALAAMTFSGTLGCAVGPDAPTGNVGFPESYSEIDPKSPTTGLLEKEPSPDFSFWKDLGDPLLSELVERALSQSPDVAHATAKLRESGAIAGAAWAALLPELRGSAGYARERLSSESPLLSEFHASQIPGFVPDFNDFKASLQVAYELDIWGKNRRARQSALFELEGDFERRRSVGLTLAGEVTLAYVDHRTMESRRSISSRTLEARRAALQIARDRVAGGLGSELEVSRAEVEGASAEAALADLDRQIALSEHRLSVLVGTAPGALRERLRAPHEALSPFAVPVGLPAQLLVRRPDLRELSARLWAATARIGQAKADLYPQLVLQGEVGVESIEPSTLVRRAAGYWTAGPTLQIPLFDWGRRQANWTAAEERADQALHDLEKQVLVSLQEVEDAISSVRDDARRRRALARAAAAGRRSADLAADKYKGGLVTQLDVIDAQRTQFQAEDALAEADGQAVRNAVRLAKAVGGGIQASEKLMPSPEPPDQD